MGFFSSSATDRARQEAENLLRMAEKVDAYRRDVLAPPALAELRDASARLQMTLQNKEASREEIVFDTEALHAATLPCGGDIYPVTFFAENVEMLLVAAILAIGVRSFFIQPFKIPTNSMFPTYNGMTPYVYAQSDPGPGPGEKLWNFAIHGATHHEIIAPADGLVVLPVNLMPDTNSGRTVLSPNPAIDHPGIPPKFNSYRIDFMGFRFFPSEQYRYTVLVGDQALTMDVPADFGEGFNEAFFRTYFPDLVATAWNDQSQFYDLLKLRGYLRQDEDGKMFVVTGRALRKGDKVLDFDIRTGDMLFVDRFSYNFTAPKVGDPFVFHTGRIPLLAGSNGDQYFIKRLVGLPGDKLEVRPPVLYRNGEPISGPMAFDYNNQRTQGYPGYTNIFALPGQTQPPDPGMKPGQTVTIAPGYYFAMGDNSPSSYDARYWGGSLGDGLAGGVPAESVVGKAIIIIYPFGPHVGLAQ